MAGRVRIKAGPVEFEYEGETELGLPDIKELFAHVETLVAAPGFSEPGGTGTDKSASTAKPVGSPSNSPVQKLHVNSIVTKLNTKGGPGLALAAAAALQVFDQKPTFTRAELLDMMKKGTMHFNENMSKNLSSIIKSLVGSKLNQVSDGVYSLTADAHKQLESQLA